MLHNCEAKLNHQAANHIISMNGVLASIQQQVQIILTRQSRSSTEEIVLALLLLVAHAKTSR